MATQSQMPKSQLVIIILVSTFFYLFDAPVAGLFAAIGATYGGLVSLSNTWLLDRHINKQQTLTISPQMSVGMMFVSTLMRMTTTALLIVVGVVLLALPITEMIVGLVLGQIGFLIDKVRQI